MKAWRALPDFLAHEDVVIVTVAQTRGSVPREAGATMLVSMTRTVETIGGGHLEWEAMAQARAMLLAAAAPALQRLSLGASLGQCCGGVVWLVFERVVRSERGVWVERSRTLDSGKSLTRRLVSPQASHWTIGSPDEAQRNPGACHLTYPSPSPDPNGPPSPSGRGNGYAHAQTRQFPLPEGRSEGFARHAARSQSRLAMQCQSWGAERGGSKSRERGDGARSDTPNIEAPNAWTHHAHPTAWHFTQTLSPATFNITLFGAGHVGAAIVQILTTLATQIRWVDVRDDQFGTVPHNVQAITTDAPEEEVDNAPPNTFFLVLTHSHTLDLELTQHILQRDAAWFGLIGSRTKRARFEHRLQAQGISTAQLERMVCPIGVAGINNKSPQVIAIAVVAQLLQAKEHHDSLMTTKGKEHVHGSQ